ncbi:NAD(P)-dependent oxidoreductase [Castellaniella sp. GW247-6E4]|uniref:SDR family oxidoreductase n=1 Tax=Castellaniella sp. GW247-6E4 TaxID=3140380 RepID=UPI00331560A6
MTSLKGKTLFITGASRGIGKAIALRAAREGANIIIAAKTSEPDPRLPGTIHTAAREIHAAGGNALAVAVDIRHEQQVAHAVSLGVAEFGGIDILINNASAIGITSIPETSLKRYDLMMDINVRGTFVCSQLCLPHLRRSKNPHIMTLSPPIDLNAKWFVNHAAYTTSKYAMSLLVHGMASEFRKWGIGVNALWPRTVIATSALNVAQAGGSHYSRTPEIMADAAYEILTRDSRRITGNFFLDENVLRETGVTDFSKYLTVPGSEPTTDLFVDP